MLKIFDDISQRNYALPELRQSADEIVFAFTAHPNGGREAMWFHVALQNDGLTPVPEVMTVMVKHLESLLCGGTGLFRPVICYNKSAWERLPVGARLVRGDGYSSLGWQVRTPKPGEIFEMALCYPYRLADLEELLKDTAGFWRCDELGASGDGRAVIRLSNTYGDPAIPRKSVFLLARQHAMETSGAWVLDGVLRRLAEQEAAFPIWCVPLADIDKVERGEYGKDSFPQDMNRAWGPNAPMRRETKLISQDLKQWQTRISADGSLVIDFHSPGVDEHGVYAFANFDPASWMVAAELPKRLSGYISTDFFLKAAYKATSAWGDSWNLAEFCRNKLNIDELSIEISYFEAGDKILEVKDYQHIGKIIADWLIEHWDNKFNSALPKSK